MKPKVFCDVDGTLVRCRTMIEFIRHFHGGRPPDMLGIPFAGLIHKLPGLGLSRVQLNRIFYQTYFRDMDVREMKSAAASWYEKYSAGDGFFNPEVVGLLKRMRTQGREIILVSGSFREILQSIADTVGAERILCAALEVNGARFTGELLEQPMIGEGKAIAVRELLEADNVAASSCVAIGDDSSDLPMLQSVGIPMVPLSSEASLLETAHRLGWFVLD